ncbi:hypothetical protein M5K25_024120 [Dendrobium thyrsiflorum]|uniref:Uncharacterized protein n=1 Tax=Dendrobium thyrsiflorum TaxID=117978 RepID=A0ABD0U135_DENTH
MFPSSRIERHNIRNPRLDDIPFLSDQKARSLASTTFPSFASMTFPSSQTEGTKSSFDGQFARDFGQIP